MHIEQLWYSRKTGKHLSLSMCVIMPLFETIGSFSIAQLGHFRIHLLHLLQKALGHEKNIHITRVLIVIILTLSYLQSF